MRREFNIPETEECRLFKTKLAIFIVSVPISYLDVIWLHIAHLLRTINDFYNLNKLACYLKLQSNSLGLFISVTNMCWMGGARL